MDTLMGVGIIAILYFLTRKWPGMPPDRWRQVYRPRRPEILYVCWADRIIMVWSAAVAIFAIMLGIPWGPAWGTLFLYVIVPPWAFLRVVDLAMAGPRRRRAMRELLEAEWQPGSVTPHLQEPPPEMPRASRESGW